MKYGCFLVSALLEQGADAYRAQKRYGLHGWHLGPIHTARPLYVPSDVRTSSQSHEGQEAEHEGSRLQEHPEGHEQREEGHEERGEEHGEEHGKTLAILMVVSLVCASGIFALTQTKLPHVSNATVLVIDQVVAIFLAVLWFDAFDDVLDAVVHERAQVANCLIHGLVIISFAVAMAWNLRTRAFGLASFCSVAAHFTGFMGQHSALKVQEIHFSFSPLVCALGFLVICLGLFTVCSILFCVKKRALGIDPAGESSDESLKSFVERFDDVENDFVAMALSSYWVMVVRFAIVNTYPEEEIEPGSKPEHTAQDRHFMLLHAALVLVAGTFLVHRLAKVMPHLSYVPARAVAILQAFTVMCWAFSFLVWVQMFFYEHPIWNMRPLLTRVAFAAGISLLGGMCVLAFAVDSHQTGARAMLLRSTALIVGIAWEEAFDAALEVLFEGSPNTHFWKGLSALFCTAITFPSYWVYWKPYALAAEEAEACD